MGRINRKGEKGQARNYITRTQAVRRLQISLPDFRRLCIFKGIYPREPSNKKKVNKGSTPTTTFYYTKDIQYLQHEPLIRKFREHKTVAKKIGRALGRGNLGDAARIDRVLTPRITLDHIIRERYPTFVDALRDLDDALSMLFLFANLPSTATIPPKTIALCRRLTHEFEHYVITSHALRKSFLSIKGIYYQVTIQGQDILWIVPYKFVQNVQGDIDFRIMGTFVDFYTTLLGFVNYRLYTSRGLKYPPKFDSSSDELGAELGAFTIEGAGIDGTESLDGPIHTNGDTIHDPQKAIEAQKEADQLAEDSTNAMQTSETETDDNQRLAEADPTQQAEGQLDVFPTPAAADADILPQPGPDEHDVASLFKDTTFFLSRETPRHPLEFLLRAFGCPRIGWASYDEEGARGSFTRDEKDARITHQVVDRPWNPSFGTLQEQHGDDEDGEHAQTNGTTTAVKPGDRIAGRTYIQPQWVWDCVNAGRLLRPDLYAPGAIMPPHLSPWVKAKKGQYDPTKSLEEQETEAERAVAEAEEAQGLIAEAKEVVEKRSKKGKKAEIEAGLEDEDEDREVLPGEGMDVASSEEDDDDENNEDEAANGWGGLSDAESAESAEGIDFDAAASDEDEEEDSADEAQLQHQADLLAEASGDPVTQSKSKIITVSDVRKRADARMQAANDELERRASMMSRRKRKVWDRYKHSVSGTEKEAEKLRGKRRRIEREQQQKEKGR